ncbi:MAG: PAS domain S-box protein [Gammaproteobacteria bacterium]|nr:PAS domain S-box protein [Gammaproteobacteria bacterium]MCP5415490.1 PAS domain S-box protein [Chromatiaceae bacterium]
MTHAELLDFAKLQGICATIAERSGCDVAIMGQEGKIIASSHSESIGLIHPGAALIMDSQVDRFDVTEELARESAVMHEGCNLPLELEGRRIGCVGVAAPLAESRRYAAIVQTCVTLMLENEFSHRQTQERLNSLIASKQQAETVLRKSEMRLREMSELAHIGYWHWDLASGDVEWSEQVYRIFQLDPKQFDPHIEAIMALSPWEEESQRDKELIRIVSQSRAPGSYEQRFLLPDGDIGYYCSTYQGIYDDQGALLALEGSVQDITEQKRSHRALELSENRFRDFADSAADWFWEMGPDLRFSFLTGRVEEVMGLPPEQILGRTRREIYREMENFNTIEWQRHLHILESHLPFSNFEVRWTRPDGGFRFLSLSGKPFFDTQGGFLGYRGVGGDITARKQQERELVRLRNFLVNIINSMPSILIGVDELGRITQWNKEAQHRTGISFEEALGRPLSEVFPRLTEELDRIHWAIQSRRKQVDSKRTLLEDGELHYEDMTIYPLISNGEEGAVIRLDDITEQVRMQEMMIQSEKMLSVGGLAAGMAHEINNPLAGMMQTANVLKNRLTDTRMPANLHAAQRAGLSLETLGTYLQARKIPRMLEDIQTSGCRLAEIVDNMLSFARKGDGGGSLHELPELIDKTLILATTDYSLKKQYDFKTIEIVREYAKDLPQVPCARANLQQVLLNLFRNGAEAMHSVRGAHHRFIVRTRFDERRSMAIIEIEDNGPGMVEAVRKRVFEPFFTTKPVGVGTGLGLSVSYFIITEIHKGQISVTSEPGKGALFTVSLPINPVSSD